MSIYTISLFLSDLVAKYSVQPRLLFVAFDLTDYTDRAVTEYRRQDTTMFATQPSPQPQLSFTPCTSRYHNYAPMRSSPLSPSSNRKMSSSQPQFFQFATQRHQHQSSPPPTPQSHFQFQFQTQQTTLLTPPASNTKQSTYAHRYTTQTANPLSSIRRTTGTSPAARAQRRNLFLNKIKEDRDAGRFEARGEQLVLMEDLKEERQWRESMGRRAERIMRDFGIDGDVDVDGEGDLGLTEGMISFPVCLLINRWMEG